MAAALNISTNTQYGTARQISLVYHIVIGILGIVSNFLVIVVFIKHEKLRTAANLFIGNLAICDLMIASVDASFSIPSIYENQWKYGRSGCIFYGFTHYFFISITVSTLAAISIDRFFHITKPPQVRSWRITRTRALGILLVIYIYVLLFTFPPLTGWNSFITEEYFYSGCYINYGDQDPAAIGYSVIASAFLFLAPLIVMTVCYHKIYTAVRTSTRKTISRALGPTGTPSMSRRKHPIFKRTHVQTAKMIIVVIFFCVIVWLPYVVVSLITAFTGNSIVSPLASHITILITKSCVVYNVLIYVFLNRKLKAAISLLICCGRAPGWLSKESKTSVSKMRFSRAFSENGKELPSDIIRNRRSVFKGFEQGNDSGNSSDNPAPALNKENGISNAGLSVSPPTSLLRNGTLKSLDSRDDSSLNRKVVAFDDLAVCGVYKEGLGETTSGSLSQFHSEVSQNNVLSFSALEDRKQPLDGSPHPGHAVTGKQDVTKVEARRRALRKMNQKEAGTRKLPSVPSSGQDEQKADTKSNQTASINNDDIELNTNSTTIILHSRENSSSTDFPSSNNSTMSGTSINVSTVKDDSSLDATTSPRTASVTTEAPRNLPRKSKTLGYRGGRHTLLRERLRNSSKDPLQVSPSELQEIRTYWKRMSLCLDEINIDEEV